MQFALTGDAGGDRPKLDDVIQGIPNDGISCVDMRVTHAGTTMVLHRALSPNYTDMAIGDKTWQNVTEVNKELWARLGTTKKQIVDYVFVGQRKIDEMFDQKPAERAVSLAALFGLTHAAAVWKQTGEFINSIEVPTTLLDEDALMRRLGELAIADEQLRHRVSELHVPQDPVKYREQRQATINGYHNWVKLRDEAAAAEAAVAPAQQALAAAQEQLAGIDEDLKLLQEAVENTKERVASARKALQQWQLCHASQKGRDGAKRKLEAVLARNVLEPKAPQSAMITPTERDMINTLRDKLARAAGDIAFLKSSPESCSTCGQRMPDLANRAAKLAELEQAYKDLRSQVDPLEARDAAWQQYLGAKTAYDAWVRDVNEAHVAFQALKDCGAPELNETTAQAIVNDHNEFLAAVSATQERRNQQVNAVSKLEGECVQLLRHKQSTAMRMHGAKVVVQASADQAREEIAALEELLANSNALTMRWQRIHDEQRFVGQQLEECRAVQSRGEATRLAVQDLSQIRQVFHHNESPRMVSYTYVENMLEQVNSALEIFDAPYRVVMDEQLGFIANFLDGIRKQPDRRLSVGERIVLALAFRIAVNSAFAAQIGVLCMDEPTVGLDEHNLGCLPHAIERLKELSEERGLQVFFVTHEQRLLPMFDNVIQLPAASL
jgi:DNA repair exonuclease SbcCD ATPase subunit